MPKRASMAHEVLQHRRVDGAGRRGRGRPAAGRARVRARSGRSAFVHVGDPLDAVAQQAHVAPHQRGEDVDDRRLLDRVEPADGAEVDQSERAVGEGEDVAGVRDRRGRTRCAAPGRASSAAAARPATVRSMPAASSVADVGDGEAVEALLHEQPPGAELAVDASARARRCRCRAAAAISSIASAFAPEVELGAEARSRTARASRPIGAPDRTACAAARRRRAARARRGRAR